MILLQQCARAWGDFSNACRQAHDAVGESELAEKHLGRAVLGGALLVAFLLDHEVDFSDSVDSR